MTLPRPTARTLTHLSQPSVADQCLRLYRGLLADRPHPLNTLALRSPKDAA